MGSWGKYRKKGRKYHSKITLHKNPRNILTQVLQVNKKKIAFAQTKKKAPEGFEPSISCLLDRRFNQLSHGALHMCRNSYPLKMA